LHHENKKRFMKTLYTLMLCLTIGFVKAQLPANELINSIIFENLKGYSDGYGTSIENPLCSGAFKNIADKGSIQNRMVKLKNTYRWPDGSTIDFSKRGSTMGKTGIVDRYTLENPITKEIVTLFVDPYKTDSIFYIPKGLVAVNQEILAKEIAPYLTAIDEINNAKDAYKDKKEEINKVSNYLASNIGIGSFVDRDNLLKVITDTQAGTDLKSYLFGIYVLNKFYALGKNISAPKEYALNKMKTAFLNFQKSNPEVESGNIKINLNE